MNGLDFVVNEFSFIDQTRLAALGASFGGYMINWINGHTDRFACLVTHDGIFDTTSSYYNSDELWFPEFEV
jgi:acylaminoacyl-peptidase